jgi:predicted CXXCH cytochrome family protein
VRRLALLLTGGAVWLLLGAVPVFADNGPHHQGASPVTDGCSGCHRAHTGQASNLLVTNSQTALCYTCHGTTGTGATTDVQDGVQYAPVNTAQVGTTVRTGSGTTFAGALRGGGFDNAAIDTSLSGPGSAGGGIGVRYALGVPAFTATTSKHMIDTTSVAYGIGNISATANAGTSIALTCASCHDPHGNGHYRILKPTPDNAYTGAYSGISPAQSSMSNVNIVDTSTYVYTTTDYWHPEDANQVSYITNVSMWCASCHTRYLASAGSATTDSGDAIFKFRHETTGNSFVGNATGAPPTCVQCHVSHGSNAFMGSNSQAEPWPGGSAPRGPDSNLLRIDSRGVCEKCHNK